MITGMILYDLFVLENLRLGVGVDGWDDLDVHEKQVWQALANNINSMVPA